VPSPRSYPRNVSDAAFITDALATIPSYADVTYTFGVVPDDIFNLMSRDRWIEPVSGQAHHWAFDVLMLSLCGGNPEIVDHLEHLIAFKYLNPGEFRVPSVVAFGEGGTGKNLLVDTVLWRIFGGATISVLTDQVLGQFNDIILGKVFLLFNEATDVRTDMLRLKNFLGSQRVAINPKGVAPFWVDNIAMVMFGGDSLDPGIKPHGGGADRRWSVWQVPRGKTLVTWIAEARGWTLGEAKTWLTNVTDDAAFQKDSEIAKWPDSIIAKN
jgi:hypothetical protein